MTWKICVAFALAFVISACFGHFYVPWLRKVKFGQEIKSQVTWHSNKAGTPTMGGVMFIFAILVVCLTIGFPSMLAGNFVHLAVFAFAAVFGLIGFLDDWNKIRNKNNTRMFLNRLILETSSPIALMK